MSFNIMFFHHRNQGLIQKEKVLNDREKGAQISILASKILTQS